MEDNLSLDDADVSLDIYGPWTRLILPVDPEPYKPGTDASDLDAWGYRKEI